jgi:hypothetical protein
MSEKQRNDIDQPRVDLWWINQTKQEPTYPQWICHPCGIRHGNRIAGIACWHFGLCGICQNETSVTEPRDFGHLKHGWENFCVERCLADVLEPE